MNLASFPAVRVTDLQLPRLGVQTFAGLILGFLLFQREWYLLNQVLAWLLMNHMVFSNSRGSICLVHSRKSVEASQPQGLQRE